MTSNDPTTEPSTGPSAADHPCIPQYEIRVEGHLGTRWSAWFDGLDLTDEEDGITVIRGPVVDQAALHGLLQKLRDVGIPLVSLTPVSPTPVSPASISPAPVSHDATTTPEPTLRRNEGN